MNLYRCTDGFVTKYIEATGAKSAAEGFALVPCSVSVGEIDAEGQPVGESEIFDINAAE